MKRISFMYAKQRAMALALSLIMLLAAGMMVAVSMYLVENMMATTKMKNDDELRMNAALVGLEEGKQWIINALIADGSVPKRENSSSTVSSGDMAGANTSEPEFEFLVVVNKNNNKAIISGTIEGVSYKSVVYDLTYTTEDNVEFVVGLPIRMNRSPDDPITSALLGQRTEDNQNIFSDGAASEYGFYIVRSTSVLNGIERVIEQGVRIRE